jgi:hypothetical protein
MTVRPQVPRIARVLRTAVLLGALVSPAGLMAQGTAAGGTSINLRADWLGATETSMTRSAMPSLDATIEFRRPGLSFEVGYLRAAKELSTVQGGYIAVSRPITTGKVTFLPGIGLFGGAAAASADTTGYKYTVGGTTGHQPRYTYSNGGAFGGGVQLGIEYAATSTFGIRASLAEWIFSGSPIKNDTGRFLAGVGLTVRLPQAVTPLAPAGRTR